MRISLDLDSPNITRSERLNCVMAMGRPFDLPYSVELWDDEDRHVEELIALTGDYRVASRTSEGRRA